MYDLVGINGNAFSVMGYVQSSMKAEGRAKEEIDAYIKKAQSGDYNNLLCESIRAIDELNREL